MFTLTTSHYRELESIQLKQAAQRIIDQLERQRILDEKNNVRITSIKQAFFKQENDCIEMTTKIKNVEKL